MVRYFQEREDGESTPSDDVLHLGVKMEHDIEKDWFINSFMMVFMATWCANNYTDYCMRGQQALLSEPPVEDAQHLAEEAYEHMCNI